MSFWSSVGGAVSNVFSGSSWGNIIAGGLSAAGSLVSTHAQSQASKQEAKAQSQEGVLKQIEYNRQAQESTNNAQLAINQSALKAALIRRAGRETAQSQDAQYAASGVEAGVGSAAYVPSYTVGRAEEDAYTAFQEGLSQAQQYNRQAQAYIDAGKQAYQAGQVAASGTASAGRSNTSANLLNTFGSLAKTWLG